MKNISRTGFLREHLFGKLPLLGPAESLLLRVFMIPVLLLVRAEGLGHIRGRKDPLIFAFNHNNSLESLLVPAFLIYHGEGRKISFVIDWMFGKIPFAGRLVDLVEPMYVYHKRSTSAFIEVSRPDAVPAGDTISRSCEKLREGKRVGIFPEGRRNRDPFRLLPAKTGVGHIALRSGVPVVPVGIDYPQRRQKARIPVFGKIVLSIGRPLSFDDLAEEYLRAGEKDAPEGVSRRAERHVLAWRATQRVMRALSPLCGKRYVAPEPPVFHRKTLSTNNQTEEPCPG